MASRIFLVTKLEDCQIVNNFCEKLDNKGIEYQTNEDVDYMIEMGFRSTPQLMLENGTILDFSAANAWINNLED